MAQWQKTTIKRDNGEIAEAQAPFAGYPEGTEEFGDMLTQIHKKTGTGSPQITTDNTQIQRIIRDYYQ